MTCRSFIQTLSIYGFAVILGACGLQSQKGMERDAGDFAIRGGQDVTTPADGKNPKNPAQYTVTIATPNTDCTGSLIGRRMILTAAHCLFRVNHGYQIAINFDIKGDRYGTTAEDFRVHPLYQMADPGGNTNPHDLALIELPEDAPAEFSIVELPTNLILLSEMKTTISGYGKLHGRYDESKAFPGVLRQLDVTLFIKKGDENNFYVNQIEKGFCNGDSGGPAIYTSEGKSYVVGVVSFTLADISQEIKQELIDSHYDYSLVLSHHPEFDMCSGRGAYVNVKAHADWIQDTAAELIKAPFPEDL